MTLFENRTLRIEVEQATIPWLKIFAVQPVKELTDCDKKTKKMLFKALELCERELRAYYRPDKINVASFGNYVPQVHLHVMARFRDDSHFPEPMWGTQQRTGTLHLPPFEPFARRLSKVLRKKFS